MFNERKGVKIKHLATFPPADTTSLRMHQTPPNDVVCGTQNHPQAESPDLAAGFLLDAELSFPEDYG
jgi:hypothetical protein